MVRKELIERVRVSKGGSVLTVLGMAGGGTTTPNVVDTKKEVTSVLGTKKIDIETAYWGTDNKLPHDISTDVKGVTVISSGLRKKAKIHFGQGIVIVQRDEDGKPKEVKEGAAFEFFKKNRLNKKTLAHVTDLEWFQIAFVEYILSNEGSDIVRTNMLSAPYCRISIQEEDLNEDQFKYFRSKYVVFSKQWANDKVNEETSEVIPMVDPEWSAEYVKVWCAKNKIKKFVRPAAVYMPETDYYPEPYWNSARTSGWTEIAKLIPKVKKAIIQNSMTLKYLVKIPHDYFLKKYPDLNEPDRAAAAEKDLTLLDDFLSNYENTGGNLTTYYDTDRHTGKEIGSWQIEVIDNKLKDGVLNLDGASANSEILFAIGIDPTLVGSGMPGKEMGAKSGSDKREAFNIAVADAAVDREVSLEYAEFLAEYNGWDAANEYKYKNTILATTDEQPTGVETKI